MPEIDTQTFLWGVAGIVALVIAAPVILGPIIVYTSIRFRPSQPFLVMHPDDPRLPPGVRWFFGEVWSQLRPLGFEPTAYLIQRGLIPNSVTYLGVFDHRANRDGAAAMVVVAESNQGSQCSNFVAEFATESIDNVDVCTNNGGDPTEFTSSAKKRILKIPGMRDLAALYKCHRMHWESTGLRQKKSLAQPEQRANQMQESILREFEDLVTAGRLRRVSKEAQYQFGLGTAVVNTWKLLPGISAVGRALVRRRARRWLSANGMTPGYQVVNFKRLSANRSIPKGTLPLPDWYSSSDSPGNANPSII